MLLEKIKQFARHLGLPVCSGFVLVGFSPASKFSNFWICLPSRLHQVVEKESLLELVHRDAAVAEAWAEHKLVRESSHSLLRTLVAQLEQVLDKPIQRALLPDTVRVGPHTDPDDRILQLSDSTLCINNARTSTVYPVFPMGFRQNPSSSSITCSTGAQRTPAPWPLHSTADFYGLPIGGSSMIFGTTSSLHPSAVRRDDGGYIW